jgi:hypothetical protein
MTREKSIPAVGHRVKLKAKGCDIDARWKQIDGPHGPRVERSIILIIIR